MRTSTSNTCTATRSSKIATIRWCTHKSACCSKTCSNPPCYVWYNSNWISFATIPTRTQFAQNTSISISFCLRCACDHHKFKCTSRAILSMIAMRISSNATKSSINFWLTSKRPTCPKKKSSKKDLLSIPIWKLQYVLSKKSSEVGRESFVLLRQPTTRRGRLKKWTRKKRKPPKKNRQPPKKNHKSTNQINRRTNWWPWFKRQSKDSWLADMLIASEKKNSPSLVFSKNLKIQKIQTLLFTAWAKIANVLENFRRITKRNTKKH